MLAGWVSYVKTSLSPKAWLAKQLAHALQDVFVLDNTDELDLESNLLSDTKIALKKVRIRPRRLSSSSDAWLIGEVDAMEFSWTWGGGPAAANTRLTIRGVRLRIVLHLATQEQEQEQVVTTPAKTLDTIPLANNAGTGTGSSPSVLASVSASAPVQQASAYLQRQVQQIVDHLTLDMTDFTLHVEEDGADDVDCEKLRVQAKSLQLVSFGRQPTVAATAAAANTTEASPPPPLSQRISLESIGMAIVKPSGEELPLLEPIGYAASVQRVAGRRFLDGWNHGLEVVGEILDSQGLVLHAGNIQLQTIRRIVLPLMNKQEANCNPSSSNHDGAEAGTTVKDDDDGEEAVFYDSYEEETLPPNVDNEDDMPATLTPKTTTISMPLPSVTIVLPSGTTIHVPGCTWLYHMDGSKSQILGRQGIFLAGQPFLKFTDTMMEYNDNTNNDESNSNCDNATSSDNAKWKMDFVQHLISLEQAPTKSPVTAHFEWNDTIIQQVANEFQQIMSVMPNELVQQVESAILQELEHAVAPTTTTQPVITWRVESGPGAIVSLRATSQRGWAQASLQSPRLAVSTDPSGMPQLQQLELDSAQIGPTSFGTTQSSMIRIPAFAWTINKDNPNPTQKEPGIVFQDQVNVTLESRAVLFQLHEFGLGLVVFAPLQEDQAKAGDIATKEPSHDSNSSKAQTSTLPFLQIPGVRLKIEEESLSARLDKILVRFPSDDKLTISCGTLQGFTSIQSNNTSSSVECLSVQGITAQLGRGNNKVSTLSISRVNNVCLMGYVEGLSEPLLNVRFRYDSSHSKIQMDVPSALHLLVAPSLVSGQASKETSPSTAPSCLPCSLKIRLANLKLSSGSISLCFQPLQVAINPGELDNTPTFVASLWGKATSMRLCVQKETHDEARWIDASIDADSKITLSNACEVESLECPGAHIGNASCGHLDVSIPPFSYSRGDGSPRISSNGSLSVALQSVIVANGIQSLLESVIGNVPSGHKDANQSDPLSIWQPMELVMPEVKVVIKEPTQMVGDAQNISLRTTALHATMITMEIADDVASYGPSSWSFSNTKVTMTQDYQRATISLDRFSLRCLTGIEFSLSDVNAELEAPAAASVTIRRVDTLMVPMIFDLRDPIIGTTLSFSDGLLDVTVAKVSGICPLMVMQEQPTRQKTTCDATGGEDNSMKSPCPMRVFVEELSLTSSIGSSVGLSVKPIDLLIVTTEGVLSLDTNVEANVCISDSGGERWLQASISPISAVFDPLCPSTLPTKAFCSLVKIGPCASGQLEVAIPSFEIDASSVVRCGEVNGTIESIDIAGQLQLLWNDCFPSKGGASTTAFTWNIPKVILSVPSTRARFVAEAVSGNSAMDELRCSRCGLEDNTGMAAAFSGLSARPGSRAEIGTIDALYLPGTLTIEQPVQQKTLLTFGGNGLFIWLPPISVVVFAGDVDAHTDGNMSDTKAGTGLAIPFPVRLNLQQVLVKTFSQTGEVTRISRAVFHLRPQERDPFSADIKEYAHFHLTLTSVENKLVKLSKTAVSGIFNLGSLSIIRQFRLSTDVAHVSVGFSSVDWAGVFGNQASQSSSQPISLPFCKVEKFMAKLDIEGRVIGMQATEVLIPALQGGPETDSTELVNHLTQAMLQRVPAMITNASILGESVTEMTAKTAGRAVLAASTTTGAAAASIVGLAAYDGIRGSITAGKKARGAGAGEGYKFGDISRGVVHSISQAAKSGAQTRRGSSDSYHFGDFSVGASRAVVGYAGENKSRLGAAGGAGAGMLIGCAIAGPLGLVAGSVLGSKLGGAVLNDKALDPAQQSPRIPSNFTPASRPPSHTKTSVSTTNQTTLSPSPAATDLETVMYPLGMTLNSGASNAPCSTHQAPQQNAPAPMSMQQVGPSADLLGLGNLQGNAFGPGRPFLPAAVPPADFGHNFPQPAQLHATPSQQQRELGQDQDTNQSQYQRRGHQAASPHTFQHHHQYIRQQQQLQANQQQMHQHHQQQQGYRFGDLSRQVLAKGKEKSGRSSSDSYKFGDFTRGLFK